VIWSVFGLSLILAVSLFSIQNRPANPSGLLPERFLVIHTQEQFQDSLKRIYQNGRAELGSEPILRWAEDGRSFFYRVFQNTWEYCLSCRISKPSLNRYSTVELPTALPTQARLWSELTFIDSKTTMLSTAEGNAWVSQNGKWDGFAAYQEETGCWVLAGYQAKAGLLAGWVNFCQVDDLLGLQPVQGSLSPDGWWAAFAAGRDRESFESIWLLFLETSQE
jgi:hypothetical protein